MLTDLVIRNFAIIDHLEVSFGRGFNILTGETGAGKSIIIDAVGLLLGDRARPDLIRTGEEEATVEALFDLSGRSDLQNAVSEAGFEAGEDLIVRRIVSRSGKNRVYINGSLARLGQLQSITSILMVIYGQHEHQQLQRTEQHLMILDQVAAIDAELDAYRHFYQEVATIQERIDELETAEEDRQQRLDLLSFQSREIAEAQIHANEEEELTAERNLLQNAEKLAAATAGNYEKLYGAEGALLEGMEAIASDLEDLSDIDPQLGQLAEAVRSSIYALEDVAGQLRTYGDQIVYEPQRLNEVEERLAQLGKLKRKYAPTLEGILEYHAKIEEEIDRLTKMDITRGDLLKRLEGARQRLLQAGEKVSERRREAAEDLREAVEDQLKDLVMDKARFEMRLFPQAQPGPHGLERGEFYLAANPGEEPRPLAWIASGGELSRIMLALQNAAPAAASVPTLIFDEVDAGIGGIAATAVGQKLREVALGAQVLCITHLPQVAAFAENHFHVQKSEENGRTATSLTLLDNEARVLEMARMLGGAKVTDRTLEHAREIISSSAI